MRRTRVLLADDHALVLEGFARLLSEEYDVVGKVSDGQALVAAAVELNPDVVVMDIAMPHLTGLDAARAIRREVPQAKLVFVTMTDDPEVAAEAFRLGASAYLLKRSAGAELATAIGEVVQGRSYVTPLITADLLGSLLEPRPRPAIPRLTPRQTQIVQLLAEGRSMKEIGGLLQLTPRTVAFHKYRIMEQLGLKTTAELVQYAVRQNLV